MDSSLTLQLNLRYFASLREAFGPGQPLAWAVPAGQAPTAGALRAWLRAASPEQHERLDPARGVRVAVNQALAAESAPLSDGDEVAFFPPVTGG